jgi:ergothioneine biosynthesis protein EgtB
MASSGDRATLSAAPDREALAARFRKIRARTLELSSPLTAEDQAIQSMPDASPTKWHLAHTSWFFETFVLEPHLAGYKRFDPSFAYLFNSYYEAEGPRHPRPERGMLSRPSQDEILAYRAHVDESIAELLPNCSDLAARVVDLGLHHEQQHQELLLMDIKHLLSLNPLAPAYGAFPPAAVRDAPALQWISFEGGLVEIGHDGTGFAFDNEGPRHKAWLEPFRLASRLATNADYVAFIEDGGYHRPEFWLSDGWAKVCEEKWGAPLYWRRGEAEWSIFTLAGLQPMNLAAPVCHLSYYEADAFARWSGARLPTEAEWETAAATAPAAGNLAESGYYHPQPAKGERLTQMIGDAWEWTQSPYTPYPRYRPADGALGEYNGKFMANQFVLRGGSAATPADHIRITYRNFFPPHARWAFAGVRLADDA